VADAVIEARYQNAISTNSKKNAGRGAMKINTSLCRIAAIILNDPAKG